MEKQKTCHYCGSKCSVKEMSPLYQKGKEIRNLYCDKCVSEVKYNLMSLPWKDDYYWGTRGSAE
jgi:transcription elongation factor Elf1